NAILTVACAGPTRPASGQEKPIMAISARPASSAQRLLPILGWLPAYRREWLLPDVLAGLAVWAVMVPEGMAYSGIVGVPPITGLYTIIPPLMGKCKHSEVTWAQALGSQSLVLSMARNLLVRSLP